MLVIKIRKNNIGKKGIVLYITMIFIIGTFVMPIGANPADPWWDSNWNFRKEITIDHTKVAGDLTDFPILIHITDSNLSTKAQPDGDDIKFTSETGTELSHEIEQYTPGELTAWVKIPYLSSTTDTNIYMYYGNPTASNQENIEGTWDNNYLAVHHLEETSGTIYDSTINNNDGTPYGNLNQDYTGKIDGADYFDGTDDRIILPQIYTTETQFTIETWIYPQKGDIYFISQWTNSNGAFLRVGTAQNRVDWYIGAAPLGSGSITGITLNTWYHIVLTYDGSTAKIYRNAGTPNSKTCPPTTWPTGGTHIGDRFINGRYFLGSIDEVRFSNIARTSEWITTEYNNQNNPSNFYSIGDEVSTGQTPVVYNEEPLNDASNVPISLSELNFQLSNPDNNLMSYTVTTNPDIIDGPKSGSNIPNGAPPISIPIINKPLYYNTLYTWSVAVTDGTHPTNKIYSFTTSKNTTIIAPIVSDFYPNNNQIVPYNPRLTVKVYDANNDPLIVKFRTNASGAWETIGTYYGYNEVYMHDSTGMNIKNKIYYWSANIYDGTVWVNKTYHFTAQAFVLKWSYNNLTSTTKSPLASDVDNDGIYEVFAIGNDKITCFNGSTGEVKWTYIDTGLGYDSQMEIGDLNNDGIEELVASAYGRTIALHANNGKVYWNVRAASSNKNIVIADIEGNGYPYVYIASDDISQGENGNGRIRKLRGTDGTVLAAVFAFRPCYGSLSFADSDNDGKFELYSTDRSYGYSDDGAGRGMICYDADTLDILWYNDAITCSSHCQVLVDVNNDGILDSVAMQESGTGYLYVIDGRTWDKMIGKPWMTPNMLDAHSQPSVYDIDNDGNLELITCSSSPAHVWDLGRWALDTTLVNTTEPPKIGNIIGDEKLEIIDTPSITPWQVSIYNQSYQLVEKVPTKALAHTIVQDIDNNGRNELILIWQGTIKVYDTSGIAPEKLPRTNSQFYSERRTGAAVYIPPPGAPQPIIKETLPSNRSQDIQLNPTLCAHVVDFHYDLMNITISTNATGSWVNLKSYHNVGNGWYNITTTTMNSKNKTYYWRVTAIDPYADKITTIKTYQFTTDKPPVISSIIASPSEILPGGSVNITCKITDNTMVDTSTVKVNILPPTGPAINAPAKGGTPYWEVLTYDDFESGWGNYTDGGTDCSMYTGTTYSHQPGNKAINLQDFMDVNSSVILTQSIDVDTPRYTSLKVDFWFKAYSMEYRENFWVKYYDGKNWRIAADYLNGTLNKENEIINNIFYHKIVWINETDFTFPNNMKIRFQCDASNDADNIYIDQVYINATTAQGPNYYYKNTYTQPGTYQYYIKASDIHGNTIQSGIHYFNVIDPNAPILLNPSPTNGAVNVMLNPLLSIQAKDLNHDYMNIAFKTNATGVWQTIGTYNGYNGTYQQTTSTMKNGDTRYYWSVNCTDGDFWTNKTFSFTTITDYPVVSNPSPMEGALNVPIGTNKLYFHIIDNQGSPMSYTVETSPDIGSGSMNNVGNGIYSINVGGLVYFTTYTWFVNVTDGTLWTYKIYTFTTESIKIFDPFTQGWQYMKMITIDHARVSGGLTNFPVLIDIIDTDIKNKAQPDADDILFMDNTGMATKLDHQIEFYDKNTGHLIAWVNVPVLSSTTDTTLYMYYGQQIVNNQQNVSGAWNSRYRMVQHLNETSGTQYDSTSNNNDGIPTGGLNQNAVGIIDGADAFNGIDAAIGLPEDSMTAGQSEITLEFWINPQTWDTEDTIWDEYYSSNYWQFTITYNGWFTRDSSTGNTGSRNNDLTLPTITPGVWHHLAFIYSDSLNIKAIYLDGLLSKSTTTSIDPLTSDRDAANIGFASDGDNFNGKLDEVRLSKYAYNSSWIITEYNNQKNPSLFYSVGSEQENT